MTPAGVPADVAPEGTPRDGWPPEDASTGRATRAAALRRHLGMLLEDHGRLLVVSNRGPLSFRHADGSWDASRGSGGLVTALAEVGRLAPVTWVSTAMDEGDRDAARALDCKGADRDVLGGLITRLMPGQDLHLSLVEVPPEAYLAHYATVANPFLWFVQHGLYMLPYEPRIDDALMSAWRDGYRVVNELLAERVLKEAGAGRPVVMLQDYHLYLAAGAIRDARPDSLLLHFNHIPWPAEDAWQVLPQALRRVILEGLLANDILGFQTTRYAGNFLRSVASFIPEARVDPAGRHIRWRGRTVWVRAYPISVDPDALVDFSRGPEVESRVATLRERLERAGRPRLIVRVDRLEPSKNVLRGFLAFEALLARRPDLRESVRFLAIQSTSRETVPEYAEYARAVRDVVARVNGFADPEESPIWLLDGSDYALAIGALRLADVVLVNPIIDGMNLVAKEAILVGSPVLVLSETAGAAEQLAGDALTVSAADVAGTARILEQALEMPGHERLRRLRRLRASVRREDLAWWLGRQLRDLAAVAAGERPPSRQLRDTLRSRDFDVLGFDLG